LLLDLPIDEGERMKGRILVVDDDRAQCQFLADGLRRREFEVQWHLSAEEALQTTTTQDFDVVVTDLRLGAMDGIALCEQLVANRPDLPIVVITAFGSLDTAVAAIRAGAYDVITKPIDIGVLQLALDRALGHRALREEVKRLRKAVAECSGYGDIIGSSPAMRKVHGLLDRVADSETTILVTGESGTGKELVARALHQGSRRRHGPFVAINCSAIPEQLLESQLFGHVRGAFTDAREARNGLFAEADKGTLFLDEIADLPLALQPKILRALQERTLRPVGGTTEMPFDVRLIAATNRDLESAVEERKFREDLFFRINVVAVELPPLRARGTDVLLLAQHFVTQFARRSGKPVTGLSAPVAQKLLEYSWPGNVRELQNCIERAVALTAFEQLTVEDLPPSVREHRKSHVVVVGEDPSELPPLEVVEKRYILRVLEAVSGNRTLAARILGLDRKTLRRRLVRPDESDSEPPTEE
jgi:two-component system response regulator AtoC